MTPYPTPAASESWLVEISGILARNGWVESAQVVLDTIAELARLRASNEELKMLCADLREALPEFDKWEKNGPYNSPERGQLFERVAKTLANTPAK